MSINEYQPLNNLKEENRKKEYGRESIIQGYVLEIRNYLGNTMLFIT